MSNVLIQSSTLTGIADAIRAKDGSTAQMYPSEMAGKILAIEALGDIDASLIASDNVVYSLPSAVSNSFTTTENEVYTFTPKYSGKVNLSTDVKSGTNYAGYVYLYSGSTKTTLFSITKNTTASNNATIEVVAGTVYKISLGGSSAKMNSMQIKTTVAKIIEISENPFN